LHARILNVPEVCVRGKQLPESLIGGLIRSKPLNQFIISWRCGAPREQYYSADAQSDDSQGETRDPVQFSLQFMNDCNA